MMTTFEKGLSDTLNALGIRNTLTQKLAEDSNVRIPSYRTTPLTILFGRYAASKGVGLRDTVRAFLRKLKQNTQTISKKK